MSFQVDETLHDHFTEQQDINFIKERAKLAEEDRKASLLTDKDVAMMEFRQYASELSSS